MLTGKMIHEQFLAFLDEMAPRPGLERDVDWPDVPDSTHKRYELVATRLNKILAEQEKLRTLQLEWKIRALEHLCSDFSIFVWELCKWPNNPGVDVIVEDLLSRTKALLPEEDKE